MTCIATTSRKFQCINQAQDGAVFCASHDPRRQCGATTKTGTCKRLKVSEHR